MATSGHTFAIGSAALLLLATLVACDADESGNGGATTTRGPMGSTGAETNTAGNTSATGGGSVTGGNATTSGSSATGGGALITIRGSGFGTRSTPTPILFDDFEGGAPGAKTELQAAVVGAWQTGAGSDAPVYSDEVVRDGARSCKHPFTSATYNASLSLDLPFEKAYLDAWFYLRPIDAAVPDGLSRNWKPFRFYGGGDAMQTGVTLLNGLDAGIVYFEPGATAWLGSAWPAGEWVHVQFWMQLNAPGQSDGTIRAVWRDNDDAASGVSMRGDATPMNEVRIGHYWATDGVPEYPYENPGADVFTDSVYFDTSWARIEIGDAESYEACTHREIQIAETWSDGEVTFVPRRGTFAPGSYWVFVIDDGDVVRARQPVVL